MKLGELRSAIRKHKGNVLVRAELGGQVIDIPVQKTLFINETLDAFGENKGAESGLVFDDGVVMAEGGAPAVNVPANSPTAPAAAAPAADLLSGGDDLLGGGDLLAGGGDDLLSGGGDDLLAGGDDLLGGGETTEAPALDLLAG